MSQLFYDKENKAYFLVLEMGEVLKCDDCGKIIPFKESMFIHRSFTRRNYKKSNLCLNCIKRVKTRVYDEFINAEVTQVAPEKSIIVPEYKPGLQSAKNLTVFDVNEINKMGGETIDHCKVSHNSNRNIMEGALEHKERVMDRIEKLDKEASMEDVADILNAKPVIGHKGKRRLGCLWR